MKQNWINIALLGAITFTPAAFAETPTEPIVLDEIVVTATRMPQPLAQTTVDTTVINEQEIRQSAAPDIPTLLRSLAGVEVTQSGGLGKVSSTFIRGTNSKHVLVLIDGVRVNSATDGATALEHIMTDSIERIEIVRGNVSSLYGSEAIGGVIQLFTKRGQGAPAFNAGVGFGSHGTQRFLGGYAGSLGDNSFSVNMGVTHSNGVSAINSNIASKANPDSDGYDNTTFNAMLKHSFNADHQLSASVFATSGDSQYDNASGVPTDRNNTKAAIEKLSLTSDNQLSAAWLSKLTWARGSDDSNAILNGVQTSRFGTANSQLSWQNELKISNKQHIDLAAERLIQTVSSSTLFTQSQRNVNSLLAGYVGEYGAQQVQFNLRQDRHSDFGLANSGFLGYGLSFSDSFRATASISNAFKAPTFNDMYFPFENYGGGYTYSGNPNLKPEHSLNKEIGLHYLSSVQTVDAVYFDNRIRDLITTNELPASTMVNLNKARIDGLELSYGGDFGSTHLKLNMTTQNPRDTATGEILLKRAKNYGNVAISQDFNKWNAGAEFYYSGIRHDNDINTFLPVTLPSYQLVNLNAHYQVKRNLAATARIDNLFGRDYMQVHGYNTLGRTLFVGVNYQQ
jgi:vitamin B12 transporter